MPWKRTDPVQEREGFVALAKAGGFSMSELCAGYGISRMTGYRLLARFEAEGPVGLRDRSRRPHRSPAATAREVVDALVADRHRHPRWGAKKLLKRLGRSHPELALPARSTVSRILKREGLVTARPRRRHGDAAFPRGLGAEAPNALWTADHKGQFRLRDGQLCYPLTIVDAFSRYLLRVQACASTSGAEARPIFEASFREFGLPERLLSDNGPPFGSGGRCGLSRLTVWWLKLGIQVERITRGHPEENAAHERMHRELKAEATRPREKNARAQQRRLDAFRREYNEERPHEGIGQSLPAELYHPSGRGYTGESPGLDYPIHWLRRQVRSGGTIKWRGQLIFLSEVLEGEPVGLDEIEDELWNVYFGSLLLGRLRATGPRNGRSGYAFAPVPRLRKVSHMS